MEQLVKVHKEIPPKKLTDADLLFAHAVMHRFWHLIQQGKEVEGWSKEDVVNYHTLCVQEMLRRKMKHHIRDSLDRITAEMLHQSKKALPVYPSDSPHDKPVVLLEEILPLYDEGFKIVSPAVYLTGSIVNRGFTQGDIDLLVNLPPDLPDQLKIPIVFRLYRALPSRELRERLQINWGEYQTPFTNHLPLYDLAFVPHPQRQVIEMSAKSIVQEAERMAEQSRREDKIVPGRFFYPLKTAIQAIQAYREAEVYKVDALVDLLLKYGKKRGLEGIPPVAVQRKFDGLHCQVHRKGDKVWVYSDDGSNITDRLPTVVKQAKQFKHDYVFDCEMEMWVEGEHQPREYVSGYVHERGEPDDSDIVVNVFDLLWLDGRDLHKEPLSERLELLNKQFHFEQTSANPPPDTSKKFVLAETRVCKSIPELKKAVQHFATQKGSEGAMVKLLDSKYPLNGRSAEIIKYKKYAELHAVILEGHETKTPGVYNYDVGLAFGPQDRIDPRTIVEVKGKRYTRIATLYNTKEKLRPGDVVVVRYHSLTLHKDPETGGQKVTIYEMAFSERFGGKPDTVSTAIRAAKAAGLYKEKEAKIPLEPHQTRKSGPIIWIPHSPEEEELEKALSPYVEYPPEDETYRYVVQAHFRGKSVHNDLRFEHTNKEYLLGWTLATQKAGKIKEDVDSLREAREVVRRGLEVFKIDFLTGEWEKKVKAGQTKPTYVEVLAIRKAPEPHVWLTVEGVVEAGKIGATKYETGVFLIVDKGTIEYGTQRPDFHEYFFHGRGLNYRLVFRKLTREQLERYRRREIEGVGAFRPHERAAFFAIRPIDQTPYVISPRAVEKGFMPPLGISALPKKIRQAIPKEYRYWEAPNSRKAREMRDALVKDKVIDANEILKAEAARTGRGRFVLQYQWWKGQRVVREGPSKQEWQIRIHLGGDKVWTLRLDADPTEYDAAAALWEYGEPKEFMSLEGDVPPGHPLNPTKATPSHITILDRGTAIVYANNPTFLRIRFDGKKLKGLWVAIRSEPEGPWRFKRSELPEPEEESKLLWEV